MVIPARLCNNLCRRHAGTAADSCTGSKLAATVTGTRHLCANPFEQVGSLGTEAHVGAPHLTDFNQQWVSGRCWLAVESPKNSAPFVRRRFGFLCSPHPADRLSGRASCGLRGSEPNGQSLGNGSMSDRDGTNAMTSTRPLLIGALCIILGELCFASMGVGVRMVAGQLPNEVVVFFRNVLGLLFLMPWLLRPGASGLRTQVPMLHLLRGVAGVSAMYCFFYALAHLPLAEAMLLKLTAPLFIPLVALLWLREDVSSKVWLGLGVGFAGVVVILEPGLRGVSPVALIGLLGGALAAVAKVTVRRLSRDEPTPRILFYFALVATAVSATPMIWAWETPSAPMLGWLIGLAGCATLGQFLLTTGLSLAPAARMGTFGYFAVVFGAGYGWLIWAEQLSLGFFVGSVLVAAAGVLVSHRAAPGTLLNPELAAVRSRT
jgi:drug/metabolite transporter (DMT)-like permease